MNLGPPTSLSGAASRVPMPMASRSGQQVVPGAATTSATGTGTAPPAPAPVLALAPASVPAPVLASASVPASNGGVVARTGADALDDLLRIVVRCFYKPEHVVVLDALLRHKLLLSESELAAILCLQTKQVLKTLTELHNAHLVSDQHRHMETAKHETQTTTPSGLPSPTPTPASTPAPPPVEQPHKPQPRTKRLWYVDYRRAIYALMLRVHLLMTAASSSGGTVKEYAFLCPRPGCGRGYTEADLARCISPTKQIVCEHCAAPLVETKKNVDSELQKRQQQIGQQIRPVIDLVKEASDFLRVSDSTPVSALTSIPKFDLPTQEHLQALTHSRSTNTVQQPTTPSIHGTSSHSYNMTLLAKAKSGSSVQVDFLVEFVDDDAEKPQSQPPRKKIAVPWLESRDSSLMLGSGNNKNNSTTTLPSKGPLQQQNYPQSNSPTRTTSPTPEAPALNLNLPVAPPMPQPRSRTSLPSGKWVTLSDSEQLSLAEVPTAPQKQQMTPPHLQQDPKSTAMSDDQAVNMESQDQFVVTVQGRPKLFSEVTEADKELMTVEEYNAYGSHYLALIGYDD
ncbi:transcription initiation factor TFIIE subunit alpha [Pelomyxa schiedti]|nr:transcription initiation factor TFIIE subunit alpha [Pelomyxa schiedti]